MHACDRAREAYSPQEQADHDAVNLRAAAACEASAEVQQSVKAYLGREGESAPAGSMMVSQATLLALSVEAAYAPGGESSATVQPAALQHALGLCQQGWQAFLEGRGALVADQCELARGWSADSSQQTTAAAVLVDDL